jgi:hypothetical protein
LVDGCGLPQPTREFGVDSGTKKQIAGGKSRFKNAEHAFEVPKAEQVKPAGNGMCRKTKRHPLPVLGQWGEVRGPERTAMTELAVQR